MARATGAALPAGVKELRERIEWWRQTRERRTAMPPDLWAEAVELARSGRPYSVARALGLGFESLRRRMAEATPGTLTTVPNAFVELSWAQVFGAAIPSSPGTVVELSDGNGVRLTVRLVAGAEVDVARVVAAFRRRET